MEDSTRRRLWAVPCAVACALFVMGSAVRRSGFGMSPALSLTSRSAPVSRSRRHSLKTRSDYEEALVQEIGDGLYPFENLVELHRPTTLTLEDYEGDEEDVYWSTEGTSGEEGSRPGGSVVRVTFVTPGQHAIAAFSKGEDAGDDGALGSFLVTAKYVRRELRDLSDADRERYFSALHVVYSTDDAAGRTLYGDDFKSAAWFVRQHLYGAAQRDCDHWHDDAGFMTHHVGVTMLLERSLQAVDASVCSHYWDYTLDAAKSQNTGEPYGDVSELFQDDWFGTGSEKGDFF